MNPLPIKFLGYVQAGFASLAADYSEEEVDLNEVLIKNPAATFFFRATNDSMIDAHIPPHAVLVVDKSLTPKNYSIIIASVDGEFLVKYFVQEMGKCMLVPANKKYKPLVITEGMNFRIWGVVRGIAIDILKHPV